MYIKKRNKLFYQASLFFALQAATQRESFAFHTQKLLDQATAEGRLSHSTRLAFRRIKRVLNLECGEIENFIAEILNRRAEVGKILQDLRHPSRSNPSCERGWLRIKEEIIDDGTAFLAFGYKAKLSHSSKSTSNQVPSHYQVANPIWPSQPWPITHPRQLSEIRAFYEAFEDELCKHSLRLADCQKALKTTAQRFASTLKIATES